MRRTVAALLLAALAMALLAPAVAAQDVGAASAGEAGSASVVVLVLAPYMTWEDLDSGSLPTLRSLAEDSALGNLNIRSRAPGVTGPSLIASALMLSAGSWAIEDLEAPGAYNLDEDYETGDVAEAYRRFMGSSPDGASIAYLGFPRAQRANTFDTVDTVLGTLGQAIKDAGGSTIAVGNSDAGFATSAIGRDRPAALAAMNARGLVDFGDVSRRLLATDETGPYGLSTDRDRFAEEYAEALVAATGEGTPVLVVLDPGDAQRAFAFSELVSPEVAEAHRLQALETLDHVVALALEDLPEDSLLVVATPVARMPEKGPQGFGPCIVYGPGWDGYITSPSTHRAGLATLSDVSATIADAVGAERPVSMIGNAMSVRATAESLDERLATLRAADETAKGVDGARSGALNGYIALTVIAIVVATAFVVRHRYPGWLALTLRLALLASLTAPVATYVQFVVDRRPDDSTAVGLLFLATTLVLWVVMIALGRGVRWVRPLVAASSVTALVLVVDALAGSPLSYSGLLSYSPLIGARFYGMGNEGAGLLFGSLFVGLALLMDEGREAAWVRPVARWGVPVVGLLAIAASAAPMFGANVGVAAWGVVTLGVFWAQANGVRLSWRVLLAVAVAVVLLVVALSALDIGSGTQTHLARALDSADRGGLEQLSVIVARKAETNLRVLTSTNWAYVLVAVLALLGFMRWKPRGEFMEALERFPFFGHAMTALLIGGLVAYFTEDSGIVIPALMLLYPGAGVLYLMLGRGPSEEA